MGKKKRPSLKASKPEPSSSVSKKNLPAGNLQQASASESSVRLAALLATFFTGLTALVYEVAWHRYLANFLGSQAKAAAVILAVFLGGLCIGYALFGRLSRAKSPYQNLWYCSLTEIGIGLWVLVFPWLYRFVWGSGFLVDPASGLSTLWEVGVSLLLMGVPTVLMGGTLPLLTQGLSLNSQEAPQFHARIYAINTAGAFFGCLLAGFLFLPQWGLTGTLYRLAPVNLAAGICLLCLARKILFSAPEAASCANELCSETEAGLNQAPDTTSSNPRTRHQISVVRACIMACIAGFISLTLQTILIRLIGLSMGSSEYAFCMVVAVFVAMLAVGSWLLSFPLFRHWNLVGNQLTAFFGLVALYLSASYWPYASHIIRTLFASVPPGFYIYHLMALLVLALVICIPVGTMGATMPLLFGAARSEASALGSVVGRLYAWNTIGCVLGAIFGGYLLLYYADMDWIFRLCLMLAVCNFALSIPWSKRINFGQLFQAAVIVCSFISVLTLSDWNKVFLGNGLFRLRHVRQHSYDGPAAFYKDFFEGVRFLGYRDGPNSTVVVSESDAGESSKKLNNNAPYVRSIKVNGKSDGETSFADTRTMRLAAHLPLLFSSKPIEKVGVIGFGLGVTVGSLTLYPEVKDIHVVEISPVVRDFAHFFDFANYGVTKSSKVRWSIGDAYRVMGAAAERYSLIVSEPSNPWVTGVERLFSQEFYGLVKNKLEPGGIYAQWIHDYSLSEPTWGLVMRTFGESFPYVKVFRAPRDTIILGSLEPFGNDSLEAFYRRYYESKDVQVALSQMGLESAAAVLGLEIWAGKEQFGEAELQTLEFPKLAHLAGRDFFLSDDLNMAETFSTPLRRLWSRAYAKRSYIVAHRLASDNQSTRVLEDYATSACDTKQALFYSSWKSSLMGCRNSLVALSLLGRIEPHYGFTREEADLLTRLRRDSDSESHAESIAQWHSFSKTGEIGSLETLIDLFKSYDSEFVPLSAEKLLVAVRTCLESASQAALGCRSNLAEALAVTNHSSEAATVLNSIVREDTSFNVPQARREFLKNLVSAAQDAQTWVSGRTQ